MQTAKEENSLKSKDTISDSEEEPLKVTAAGKYRSNSLSEELIQRGRGRPKKDQPRRGSIDVYLSPRIEKRKLKESPEEESKKEIKKKCSTEMAESETEAKVLNAQILEELRNFKKELKEDIIKESKKRREEQEEIKKAIKDLTNKFENFETRTRQIEERLETDERNVAIMKEEIEKNKLGLEKTKKRLDNMEEKIGKLSEKNKEFERKEKMIESQIEKKVKDKIGNAEDLSQMVKRSVKEIVEKQSQKKEDTNSNIKYEERKWEEWERERRKNNIIIKGIGTNERFDKKKIEEWIEEKLGVKVNLNKIWIIKKAMLIGAECRSKEEKDKIMENKKKLKGTKFYVDNDLTYRERRNKEELWKMAREYREQGKTVKIGYNKLIVDEEVSKWDEWNRKLFRRSYKASRSQH